MSAQTETGAALALARTQAAGAAGTAASIAAILAAAVLAWLLTASLVFLWITGLWGHPSISWWSYPWQWARYLPYGGERPMLAIMLGGSGLIGLAPLLPVARWQWRRWGGVAGISRRTLGVDRIRRGTSHNHGTAAFMDMVEAQRLFPSYPDPVIGGVVVGEADRVDLGPAGRVRFDPANPSTWGNGGQVPLLIDHCKTGSTHSLVIAGGGGFKSTALVTTLLTWRKSMVVLDPATELAAQVGHALETTGRRVVRLGIGDSGPNVLAAIRPDDPMAETRLHALVGWVIGPMPRADGSDGAASRFKQWGRTIISAMLFHIVYDDSIPPDLKTLATLRAGLAVDEQRVRDRLRGIHETSASQVARDLAGSMYGMVDETFSGALGNATDDTEWLSSADYADLVSGDAFSPDDLARGDLAVFVQVPMEALRERPAVARVLIGAMLGGVFAANGQVEGRVLFALDEAVLLGNMNALEVARDQGRKYKITLQMHYQSEGQIEAVWGKPGKAAWFDGVSWRQYASIQNPETAKDISASLGTFGAVATSRGENKGKSGRMLELPSSSSGANLNEHEISREVMKPHELQQEMRADERITLVRNERPIRHGAAIGFRRPEIACLLDETSYTASSAQR